MKSLECSILKKLLLVFFSILFISGIACKEKDLSEFIYIEPYYAHLNNSVIDFVRLDSIAYYLPDEITKLYPPEKKITLKNDLQLDVVVWFDSLTSLSLIEHYTYPQKVDIAQSSGNKLFDDFAVKYFLESPFKRGFRNASVYTVSLKLIYEKFPKANSSDPVANAKIEKNRLKNAKRRVENHQFVLDSYYCYNEFLWHQNEHLRIGDKQEGEFIVRKNMYNNRGLVHETSYDLFAQNHIAATPLQAYNNDIMGEVISRTGKADYNDPLFLKYRLKPNWLRDSYTSIPRRY